MSNQGEDMAIFPNFEEKPILNEEHLQGVAETDGNEKSDRSVDKWKKSHLKTKIENYEQEYHCLTQEFSRYNSYSVEGKIENGFRFDSIAKENRGLLHILDKMNNLVSNLVDNLKPQRHISKPEAKSKSKTKILKKGSTTENNDTSMFPDKEGHKLLEIFKHEFKQLDSKYKRISSGDFLSQLEGSLETCDSQIAEVEKRLRTKQLAYKQHNSSLTRKVKNVKEEEITSITKIKSELETLHKMNEGSNDKIVKLKQIIQEAEDKLQIKTETLKNIEADALKNNIIEFDECSQKEKLEKKEFLLKKCGVLERQMKSYNKKYELESTKALKTLSKLKSENAQLLNDVSKMKGNAVDFILINSKKEFLPSITSKHNLINQSLLNENVIQSENPLTSTNKNMPVESSENKNMSKTKEKSHKPSLKIKFDQPNLEARKIEVQPPSEQPSETLLLSNELIKDHEIESKPEIITSIKEEDQPASSYRQQESSRSKPNEIQEKKRERAMQNEMAVLDELDIS